MGILVGVPVALLTGAIVDLAGGAHSQAWAVIAGVGSAAAIAIPWAVKYAGESVYFSVVVTCPERNGEHLLRKLNIAAAASSYFIAAKQTTTSFMQRPNTLRLELGH